jgi:ferredoxin
MGRKKAELRKDFEEPYDDPEKKCQRVKCKHCGDCMTATIYFLMITK